MDMMPFDEAISRLEKKYKYLDEIHFISNNAKYSLLFRKLCSQAKCNTLYFALAL